MKELLKQGQKYFCYVQSHSC